MEEEKICYDLPSHHADPFAIRTDPGRAVTDPPLIFFKTFFADHKAAGTTPAELLFFFAAVADILTTPPPSIAHGPFLLVAHNTSFSTH